jgi:predicted RND superfamily exporter protein
MDAIMSSYLSLFSPAIVSIAADGFATLTLALAHIPLIQKLAYVSAFWIFTITISVVTLHPIILYYIPPPPHDPKSGTRFSDKLYNAINRMMVRISQGTARYYVLAGFTVALVVGMVFAHDLKIGDVSIGKALMYDDHEYNIAYDKINEKFVGASQLVILAEGKEAGVIKDPNVLQTLEKFQRFMEQQNLVGGSITITRCSRKAFPSGASSLTTRATWEISSISSSIPSAQMILICFSTRTRKMPPSPSSIKTTITKPWSDRFRRPSSLLTRIRPRTCNSAWPAVCWAFWRR